MSEELIPPDVEGALRSFLRADTGVQAQMSQRVFFGTDSGTTQFPWAGIGRVGGGPGEGEEANVDDALIQIDVWGAVHDKAGCWAATAAVLAALRGLLWSGTFIAGPNVTLTSGSPTWLWTPDPVSERARYVITVPITAVAS